MRFLFRLFFFFLGLAVVASPPNQPGSPLPPQTAS